MSRRLMMEPRKLEDGRLVVMMRAESADMIGDAMIIIGPEHPAYEDWAAYIASLDQDG
jgi:hypothetical protein